MKLSDYLKPSRIIPELQSEGKEAIIDELLSVFQDDPLVTDIATVKAAVMSREKIMSTAVGGGMAVPHGKTDAVKDIVCAVGKSTKGLDFNSMDRQPTHLFMLIIGRESLVSQHLKLISRISRMLSKTNFRNNLLEAKTAEEIYRVVLEEEKSYIEL